MSTGAGSSYLGDTGAPRIEASVRVNGTIGRNFLTQERTQTLHGTPAAFPVGDDEEGTILRFEWVFTNSEMEMTDDNDDHNKVVVISSFNGAGAESVSLFKDDPEMMEHHLMEQYKPMGLAHNSTPFEPTEMTYIESEGVNVMVKGLASQPSTTRTPIGPFTLRLRNPMAKGEDENYLPGKMPMTKVVAVIKPLDPAGMDFARTLMMNMKWKLHDPAVFDRAYPKNKSIVAAGKQKALDTLVDFISFNTLAGLMAYRESVAAEGSMGDADLKAIDTMMMDVAKRMGFLNPTPSDQQLDVRRSAARKAALTDESQIFGPDAVGYDPVTKQNQYAGKKKMFSADPMAQLLEKQLNLHTRFYAAIAHLIRTLNPRHGTVVKSADVRGICEVLIG